MWHPIIEAIHGKDNDGVDTKVLELLCEAEELKQKENK